MKLFMFRHLGKTRTFSHNLKIASLLSFVAGIVNVAGFLAVQRLTTNVTGHFAFFVDEVFKLNFWTAFTYFLYIFFFFAGSLFSNFLIEIYSRKNERYIYVIPASVECLILFCIGLWGWKFVEHSPSIIALSLLFAMGLQNALVTRISNSSVRTTHLTGLFTDLGIELSQLFFYKLAEQKQQLLASIKLRLTIITFFFSGGVSCGVLFSFIQMKTLLVAAAVLVAGLVYDSARFKLIVLRRKLHND